MGTLFTTIFVAGPLEALACHPSTVVRDLGVALQLSVAGAPGTRYHLNQIELLTESMPNGISIYFDYTSSVSKYIPCLAKISNLRKFLTENFWDRFC